MKKLSLIFAFIFLLSCSKNDSPINNPVNNPNISTTEGAILKSFKHYTNPNINEHFFGNNGLRYDKILDANGQRFVQYEYDANNKMKKIVFTPDNTFTNNKILFYYDNSGKIFKMEKDRRFQGTLGELKTWLFTYDGNKIIQEFVSDENPNYNNQRIRYQFNNDGLITSYHSYSDSPNNTLITTYEYATFIYDNNKNIISIKRTKGDTHDLPNSSINNIQTSITTFEYDNQINPLHAVYMNHYLNYIFNNEYPINILNGSFLDNVLSIGLNNLKRSILQSDPIWGTPIANDYKNVFTYQTNNLPKRIGRMSMSNNIEFSNIIFSYDNQ